MPLLAATSALNRHRWPAVFLIAAALVFVSSSASAITIVSVDIDAFAFASSTTGNVIVEQDQPPDLSLSALGSPPPHTAQTTTVNPATGTGTVGAAASATSITLLTQTDATSSAPETFGEASNASVATLISVNFTVDSTTTFDVTASARGSFSASPPPSGEVQGRAIAQFGSNNGPLFLLQDDQGTEETFSGQITLVPGLIYFAQLQAFAFANAGGGAQEPTDFGSSDAFFSMTAVPEPATVLLLSSGLLLLGISRPRR